MTNEPQPLSARDRFLDVLRSRKMIQPGEEWVIDANLNAFAHELAEKQRAAIEEFDLDDHWATMYSASDVNTLPDLIDPECAKP